MKKVTDKIIMDIAGLSHKEIEKEIKEKGMVNKILYSVADDKNVVSCYSLDALKEKKALILIAS